MDYIVPVSEFQGVGELIRYCKENIGILAKSSSPSRLEFPKPHEGFPTEIRAFYRAGGIDFNSADMLVDRFYLRDGKVIKRVLDRVVFGVFPRYKEFEVSHEDIPFDSYHPHILAQVAIAIRKSRRDQFQ